MSSRQSKVRLVLFLVLIGLVLLLRTGVKEAGDALAKKAAVAPVSLSREAPSIPKTPLPGEKILERYGDPSTSPQDDMMWLARALDNFALLVKGPQPLPHGANEEIALALQGKNSVQMRYLPQDHPAFNAAGQIIDRWGTPLFFHSNAHDRMEIRSAGPDKVMWTEDDLHRKYDGRFLKGEALLAPSLFEETSKMR